MSQILGCTKQTIINISKSLQSKGLIATANQGKLKKTTFEYYNTVFEVKRMLGKEFIPGEVKEFDRPGKESLPGPGKESLPNNNNTDNHIDKGSSSPPLFPEFEDKETCFSDSLVDDKKIFMGKFEKEVEAGVDVEYYYHAVKDWSDSVSKKLSKNKRTARGWIATARKFMRSDKQDNKLQMIAQKNNTSDDEEALSYLNI